MNFSLQSQKLIKYTIEIYFHTNCNIYTSYTGKNRRGQLGIVIKYKTFAFPVANIKMASVTSSTHLYNKNVATTVQETSGLGFNHF